MYVIEQYVHTIEPTYPPIVRMYCSIKYIYPNIGLDLILVSDPLRPRLSQSRKIGRDRDETKVYVLHRTYFVGKNFQMAGKICY
jgi:hypothetical protein